MMEDLLTAEEVAKMLRVSDDTVMRLFRRKKVPGAFKVSGAWRISQRDLATYIEQQKQDKIDNK
jgi:excisionase family DNA binding protein